MVSFALQQTDDFDYGIESAVVQSLLAPSRCRYFNDSRLEIGGWMQSLQNDD